MGAYHPLIFIILGGILAAVGLGGNKSKGLAIAGVILAITALLLKLFLFPMLFGAAINGAANLIPRF